MTIRNLILDAVRNEGKFLKVFGDISNLGTSNSHEYPKIDATNRKVAKSFTPGTSPDFNYSTTSFDSVSVLISAFEQQEILNRAEIDAILGNYRSSDEEKQIALESLFLKKSINPARQVLNTIQEKTYDAIFKGGYNRNDSRVSAADLASPSPKTNNYARKPGNTKVLSTAWTDTSAKAYDDLNEAYETIFDNGGLGADSIVMPSNIFSAFRENEQVVDLLNSRRTDYIDLNIKALGEVPPESNLGTFMGIVILGGNPVKIHVNNKSINGNRLIDGVGFWNSEEKFTLLTKDSDVMVNESELILSDNGLSHLIDADVDGLVESLSGASLFPELLHVDYRGGSEGKAIIARAQSLFGIKIENPDNTGLILGAV